MNNSNKTNVLIINNHALTRFGLKTAIQSKENIYNILEAETGEQGIHISKCLKPEIVLTDMELPGINGIEAARQIKSIDENIKIIILTTHNDEDVVLDAICAGAQAYCYKHITPSKLLQIIEFIKDGAVWFDPEIAGNVLNILIQKRNDSKTQVLEAKFYDKNNEKIKLTEREYDVLKLIADGYNNAEISEKLYISIHTAKAHVCNILHKLSVDDRTQAAIKALKDGII